MDRLKDMRDFMEDYFEQNIKLSRSETEKNLRKNFGQINVRIMEEVRTFIECKNNKVNKIAICYLLSSILDESDELCLIGFESNPFVDGIENMLYVSVPELFIFAREKIPKIYQELQNHFIGVLSYEKEEIKREYMYRYCDNLNDLIRLIFQNSFCEFCFFVGAYMGDIELI